jgi:hypothetical protein
MTHLILRLEQIVQHSRGYFLHLCAFCGRELGPAMRSVHAHPACGLGGEHGAELLEQGRERVGRQGRPQDQAQRQVLRVGRTRRVLMV